MKRRHLCSVILFVFTSCASKNNLVQTEDIIPSSFKNQYDEETFRENLYYVAKNIAKDFDFIIPVKQQWTGFEPSLNQDLKYWQNKKNKALATKGLPIVSPDFNQNNEIMTDNAQMFDLSEHESCETVMELLLLQWAKEIAVIQQGSVKIAPKMPGDAIGVDGTDFSLKARVSGGMNDHAMIFKAHGDLRLQAETPMDLLSGDQDAVLVDFAALIDRRANSITYGYEANVGSDLAGGGVFILRTKKTVKSGLEPQLSIRKYVKIIDSEKHVDQSLFLKIKKVSSEKYQYSFKSRSHKTSKGRKVTLKYIPDSNSSICNVEEVVEI